MLPHHPGYSGQGGHYIETSHMHNSSKGEEPRTRRSSRIMEANFNSLLHLQTQHVGDHIYVLSSEKWSNSPKKENKKEKDNTTSILMKRHPLPPHLKCFKSKSELQHTEMCINISKSCHNYLMSAD